eukprot:TRINITY_DN105782_c0_g1_i2.p1 TRINITY_DN105782_c0_g1~~TRINITY_DN105782_c0_g1_i2.p1  ORF type:complete len:161 (-),score=28.32 TRINITY_DN105782_c0_g1_i2:233-715(-)
MIQPKIPVVSYSTAWKGQQGKDLAALKVANQGFDWTFSTPYWGEISENCAPAVERDPGLPMELLQRRDPIAFHSELPLFESDLDDNGIAKMHVKLRVMPTFWFALLVFDLRVDNVLLRQVATRFFHCFGSDEVIREFTWKEADMDTLKEVSLSSIYNISF